MTGDSVRHVPRLAVVVSHPIQYFAPLFRDLASRSDIELHVVFHCRAGLDSWFDPGFGQAMKWDIPLVEGYRHSFLSEEREIGGFHPNIVRVLRDLKPDVLLVHGYSSPTNLLAIAFAKLVAMPVLMRGDTRIMGQQKAWKSALKRLLFRMIDGFVAIGSANRAYYAAHGVPETKLFFAPFCVDNAAFSMDASAHARERARVRTELGIAGEAFVACIASKLVKQKRPADFLDALRRVQSRDPGVRGVIVGSGEEGESLRALVAKLGMRGVDFLGFKNQSELPSVFAAIDAFVFPAEKESWGLAVNEAMAAGVPVIASDDIGASEDLVANTGAGVVYKCGDIDALAAAMERLSASPAARRSMANAAKLVIANWSIERCSAGIVGAATAVAKRSLALAS